MSDLEQLAQLAKQQLEAEANVEACEEALRQAKADLRKLSWEAIPEKMEAVRMGEVVTVDGLKITVKENIRASISKPNLPMAITWLREHGHDRLIKNEVRVNVKDDKEVEEIRAALPGRQVADNPSVHPSTLSAFVREMLAEGEEIPQQLLGVFRQRESKIKVQS